MKPDMRDWEDLQESLGPLFVCTGLGEYLRIRTPHLYPDGDVIDLFCKAEGDVVRVTDLAETTGWIFLQSAGQPRSTELTRLIEDACATHGVEFNRGMLEARCRRGGELAIAVNRVARVALRISDLSVHDPSAGGAGNR